MKKKICVVAVILFFAIHMGYFAFLPAIGWKPCGTLNREKLEYVYLLYSDERYYLSEEEIDQFVEYVRPIRIYPMPLDITFESKGLFRFYYRCAGEEEEDMILLHSCLIQYNGEWYHVREKYWRQYYGELQGWCISVKNGINR